MVLELQADAPTAARRDTGGAHLPRHAVQHGEAPVARVRKELPVAAPRAECRLATPREPVSPPPPTARRLPRAREQSLCLEPVERRVDGPFRQVEYSPTSLPQ